MSRSKRGKDASLSNNELLKMDRRLMDSTHRCKIEDALTWSGDIGCCLDKERYAVRILDLFNDLGIRNVPENVETALRDLVAWEDCAGPCETVNSFFAQPVGGC